ncbi:MAG: TlpA family protein disulfide reductase [Anaerolineae bacterium]|nr:TlpA family protein disulfide reductase [Anaerolineae bacterium]
MVAAVFLLNAVALPERAQFTGRIIPGELPVAPEINAVAPPFELLALNNTRVNLLNLRGQPTVINFWATWCEPCRVEMPELQRIYEHYAERGLSLLAINLGETSAPIQQWVDQFGLTFDILLDPNQEIAALYQLRGQPTTFIVSPTGVVTHIFYGPVTNLEAVLAPFFPN